MALLKGRLIDKTTAIQSASDPVSGDDLARKSYVDQKAQAEAQAAAAGKLDSSAVGVTVAQLDGSGKVPAAQLPSYVDDVVEYASLAQFPEAGESDKIYVALDSGKIYRWGGSQYVEISGSPGSTDAVPEGSVNLYYTDARAAAAAPVQSVNGYAGDVVLNKGDVGLGNVDDTADMDKPISTATQAALDTKQVNLGTGTTNQWLRGDQTWQEIPSLGIAQVKVVSKGGSDATGDGTFTKPYATIAAAMASITDASPTKRYIIKVEAGAYSEGALLIKPNVFVVGELKEAVRVTATSVAMDPSFNAASSQDHRSGIGRIILTGACTFDWNAVTSPAGKLYFTEVAFASAVTMNGYNNAIAQAQFDSCQFFSTLTISGINVGVFKDNICYGNITLNQHPNGGMASILSATGGHCAGTVRFNAAVNDFGRRAAGFLRNFPCENLIVDGPSAYVDFTIDSGAKQGAQSLNGGNLVPMNPKLSQDLETQMLKPKTNNAHNLGDWSKQWMFIFGYVHASAGTDMYILSTMENYDPAGDSAGKSIFITADGYGLKPNVSGGNIELETAAVSGTGVRGKVQVKARELDLTTAKITNLGDATSAQDAVTKGQLDTGLSGKLDQSLKGAAGGLAELDPSGKVPLSQLPEIADAVQSVNGKTGIVSLDKSDVGLGLVDNTADLDKPLSTAAVTALAGKSDVGHTHTAADITDFAAASSAASPVQSVAGKTGAVVLAKADVGLGLVDNTADMDKPVSTAVAAALGGKADLVDGKVPAAQLPGFVDDVEEYGDLSSFPAEGSAGKLYVAQDTNKVYRWSGTVYIEISPAPGSTDEVVEGSVNLYYTDARAQAVVDAKVPVGPMEIAFGSPDGTTLDRSEFLTYDASVGFLLNVGGQMATRSLSQDAVDPQSVIVHDKVEVFGDDGTGPAFTRVRRDYLEAKKVLPSKELSASVGFDGVDSWIGASETTNGGNNISMAKIFPHKAQLFTLDLAAGNGPQPILPAEAYDLVVKKYVDDGLAPKAEASAVTDLADVVQGNFDLQQSDIDGLRTDVDALSIGKQNSLGTGAPGEFLASDLTWKPIPVAITPKKEVFVLSAGDLANGYIDCAHLAVADSMLLISGGIPHLEGASDDYTLSAVGGVTRITFTAAFLAVLSAGDRVHIQYVY